MLLQRDRVDDDSDDDFIRPEASSSLDSHLMRNTLRMF